MINRLLYLFSRLHYSHANIEYQTTVGAANRPRKTSKTAFYSHANY